MSQPTAAAPVKPRRRLWPILVALLIVAIAGAFLYLRPDPSEAALREAIAETDRLDPDWRFEDVDARRKDVPDEDNAALRVLAARKLLPGGPWPPPSAEPPSRLAEAMADLPPQLQLDEALAGELRAELAKVEPALVEARKLKGLSHGRYPVTWTPDVIGSKLSSDESRVIADLLVGEAMAQAQDGKSAEALATGRGVLVAGRSIGDEPLLISLLFRMAIRTQAVRSVERTLAQGAPPADALKAAQELFQDEETQPLLLNAIRGERGTMQRAMDAARAGRPTVMRALRAGNSGTLRGALDLDAPRRVRQLQAEALRAETACVEAAKLPLEEQAGAFEALKPAEPIADSDIVGSMTYGLVRIAASYRSSQAVLRCAVVGLALERYRNETGHWPEALDALAPAYLKTVPLDPFDGRPLRCKRLPDGVVVYSIGPDGQDDGGALNRKRIGATGSDLGFRLWDADRRRQPPAELLPPPDES